MEHVLRQCLIALRLAEGSGSTRRSARSSTTPPCSINVGCHSDAHEQAKWFGDDIAMKSIKYDHEPRSLRMAATGMRFLGSGHPPLHRFRLGLEFALSGHREVDDMIAHHAAIARTMAEQLSLPDEVARGDRRGVRALGRARAGRASSRARSPARLPRRAGRRVHRGRKPHGRSRGREAARARAARRALRSGAGRPVEAEADVILSGLDTVGAWDAVIEAEPALAVCSRASASTPRCWRSRTSST